MRTETIAELTPLARKLSGMSEYGQKADLLALEPMVKQFLSSHPGVRDLVEKLSPEKRLTVLALIAIGEGEILFYDFSRIPNKDQLLDELTEQLLRVEDFYDTLGGIVGYHLAFLRLLEGSAASDQEEVVYDNPQSCNISELNSSTCKARLSGLENLPHTGMIFPVGGAGDRLDLHDDVTDLPLPAARLSFAGRSLLFGMFRDVQGLEYLYTKVFGRQITVPVAMMTSFEKDNDFHIKGICEKNHWFHRDQSDVLSFIQPMTPVITNEGRWSFRSPLKLNLKPGGHGVIWKLAMDNGVFEAFAAKGIQKTLLRQVNNPLAGIDGNLLSLIGYGFQKDRSFGFMTCDRPVHISEGMVVLEKRQTKKGIEHCLKNVEYTDFVSRGIEDKPREPGSLYSIFPANTNILFADLKAIADVIEEHPLPGMLINLKAKFPTLDTSGEVRAVFGGRLETVMQSVADHFTVTSDHALSAGEIDELPTFVLFNTRHKVHSTTKRTFKKGVYEDQTPVRTFYDLQTTYLSLLTDFCGIKVPDVGSFCEYLERGPRFVCDFHPALGPLFDVIGQKVRGGEISENSELQMEIAELDMENLRLQGSLRIIAEEPMGQVDQNGKLQMSDQGGKCELIDVVVINEGPDFPKTEYCWKMRYESHESCNIIIHGNGEFCARGVTFKGPYRIEVGNGCRVVASMKDGEIVYEESLISEPTWRWEYSEQNDDSIVLKKK